MSADQIAQQALQQEEVSRWQQAQSLIGEDVRQLLAEADQVLSDSKKRSRNDSASQEDQ